jgi:hypothetical protein
MKTKYVYRTISVPQLEDLVYTNQLEVDDEDLNDLLTEIIEYRENTTYVRGRCAGDDDEYE